MLRFQVSNLLACQQISQANQHCHLLIVTYWGISPESRLNERTATGVWLGAILSDRRECRTGHPKTFNGLVQRERDRFAALSRLEGYEYGESAVDAVGLFA